MNILKLTPFFHHPDANSWPTDYDALGGMQIQTWRQAVWLAEHGVNQHVLTIGFPGLPKIRKLHPHLSVERMLAPMLKIPSEFSGLVGLTQSWALATITSLIFKRRKYDFDIIHIHLDGQIPAMVVACLAPRILKCPVILSVHCSRLAVYKPHFLRDRFQHYLAQWLERKAISSAFSVIALGNRTAKTLTNDASNIIVIPDMVDTNQFCPQRKQLIKLFRKRYNLRRRTVGFVGRIANEKGWEHLIPLADALQELDCEILIVGDGTQRARLSQALWSAGLEDRVTITGFIPNDQVSLAIAACELIVMPSAYEEFGGVSIEALATGVPVVAFAVGGLPEILDSITPELLIEPGNTAALTERVKELLSDKHTYVKDPQDLRTYIKHKFSPSVTCQAVLDQYHSALSSLNNK